MKKAIDLKSKMGKELLTNCKSEIVLKYRMDDEKKKLELRLLSNNSCELLMMKISKQADAIERGFFDLARTSTLKQAIVKLSEELAESITNLRRNKPEEPDFLEDFLFCVCCVHMSIRNGVFDKKYNSVEVIPIAVEVFATKETIH